MLSRSSRPDPVVLISQVRGDASFQAVERHLEQRGYQAVLSEGSAFDRLPAEALAAVDAVWVVHSLEHEPAAVNNDIDAAARSVGRERVGMLIENAVPAKAEREGFRRVHYSDGQADAAAQLLGSELEAMGLIGQSGVRRRLEATQNSRLATGLAAPLLMLFMILGMALLAVLAVSVGVLSPDSGDQVAGGGSTAADSSNAGGTAENATGAELLEGGTPGVEAGDPAGAEASDPFALVDQAPVIGGVAPGRPPSGPTTDDAGNLTGNLGDDLAEDATGNLADGDAASGTPDDAGDTAEQGAANGNPVPESCVLDLRKGRLLAEPTVCMQGGVLQLDGPIGPWHNDLGQIIISEGVVGSLRYEDTTEDVTLSAGIHQLELPRATYGIDALQLTFTGEGQHVHFIQTPENGDAELTLTFAFADS